MKRAWLSLLMACGGAAKPAADVANTAPSGPAQITLDQDAIESNAKALDENRVAREQAIEQAREAGILGPKQDERPPAGPLDKTSVRREITNRVAGIKSCYDVRLLEHADLHGALTIAFEIGGDGFVTSATASTFDNDLGDCVAGVIRSIRFPTGQGVMHVSYPLVFRTAH